MRIEIIIFLFALLLIIIGKVALAAREKGGEDKPKKGYGRKDTEEQGQSLSALPRSNLALVGGGWLLFNLVVWMVLPGVWAWWISKGLFFWGTQIAIIVLLLLNLVFKKEDNRRPVVVVSLLIAIVLIAGFISQIKWGEDDHTRKESTKVSRLCWQSPHGKQACFSATIRLKDDQLVIWQNSRYAGKNAKAIYSGGKTGPDTYRGTWESSDPFQKGEFYLTFYGSRAHGWSRETTPRFTPKYTLWLENVV